MKLVKFDTKTPDGEIFVCKQRTLRTLYSIVFYLIVNKALIRITIFIYCKREFVLVIDRMLDVNSVV
jgi:hypothetical protein